MPDQKRTFRFLQLADVLLDARSTFRGLNMSAGKRFERNADAMETFERLCDLAYEQKVDALLVNGNLWDGQSVTAATAAKLVDIFAGLGEIPVLITPGSADPYSPRSLYNRQVLSVYGLKPWSRNVHVFTQASYSEWIHPQCPQVRFYGRANLGHCQEPAFIAPSQTGNGILNVLTDSRWLSDVDETALAAFDYIACGGSANHQALWSSQRQLRGAAPGSLIGRSLDEQGMRTVIMAQLYGEAVQDSVRLERLPADRRRLVPVTVSINGVQNIPLAIAQAIEAAGAKAQTDLVHVTLTGTYPPGQQPDFDAANLDKQYFHVELENCTRPDYFLDKADQRTTAGRFIQILQDLKNKAEARGGILPATEYGVTLGCREIEDALYWGLEALNHKKVTVPDED